MVVEFTRVTRRDVLTRDLSRCVRCARFQPEGAHLHHRKLRSQGGQGTVENGVTLCAACHAWVHANVAAAQASGLIVPSWADPEVTPVLTWRGPMILTVDGTCITHTVRTIPSEW